MRRIIVAVFAVGLVIHAHAVTGRRGFFSACIKALANPAGAIVSVVDLRSEFSGLAADVAKQNSHINVLRLGGSTTISPWSVDIESLAKNPEAGGATVNMYGLKKNPEDGKLYYEGLIVGDKTQSPKDGLHIIFDPGSGSMANIVGLADGLKRAQMRLVKGGVLAIHFPIVKKPLEEFATSAVQRLSDAFSYDLLNIGLAKRYEYVKAKRIWTFLETQGSVRLDGCFVRTAEGEFVSLPDWIERRYPDFEVQRPLLASFNQLLLKRKEVSDRPTQFTLKYLGSFGNPKLSILMATQFHFFDEVSLDPNYKPGLPFQWGGKFAKWIFERAPRKAPLIQETPITQNDLPSVEPLPQDQIPLMESPSVEVPPAEVPVSETSTDN